MEDWKLGPLIILTEKLVGVLSFCYKAGARNRIGTVFVRKTTKNEKTEASKKAAMRCKSLSTKLMAI